MDEREQAISELKEFLGWLKEGIKKVIEVVVNAVCSAVELIAVVLFWIVGFPVLLPMYVVFKAQKNKKKHMQELNRRATEIEKGKFVVLNEKEMMIQSLRSRKK